ncbi:MAG: mechanosensitive ion channel family protein [Thermoplasmatota archaeon]
MRPALVLLVALSAAAALPGVAAQITLEDPLEGASVRAGESGTLTWTVHHSGNHTVTLVPDLVLPDGNWQANVTPEQAALGGGQQRFTVTLTAAENPVPRDLDVTLELLVLDDGTVTRLEGTSTARAFGHDLVFGRWANPLPAPLDGDVGLFALELAIWAAIGAASVLLAAPALKWVTSKTPTDLDHKIVGIVSKPGFLLIFTYGLTESAQALELPVWALGALETTWVLVLIFGLTVIVYRVWHEVVLGVGKKMAAKTTSTLDDRLYPLLEKVGRVIIVVAALFFAVDSLGVNLAFFAAGGAILSLVIAFAAQDTLGNLFAGVFILLDQPFREGDRIEIKDEQTWGDVVHIGLRSTRIRTRDNRMVVVPNTLIGSNAVVNHSFPDASYRIGTDVGVAYGTDVEKARAVLLEAAGSVEGVLGDQRIEALFLGFGASSLDFHVRAWFPHYLDTKRYQDKLNTAIEKALRDADIEIPFPQTDVWFRNRPDVTA